jgi:GT2 family glycosyltransferase
MSSLQFSIVIPTYNRPDRLCNCLQALSQLDYPQDRFEVIVVDDGSEKPLDSVVTPFQAMLNLTLLRQGNAGPASARNTGAAVAKGQFLVFTDDDCAPTPNWLNALAEQFQQTPNALIGGQTLNALPDNLYSTASQLLIDYLYEYYNCPHTDGDSATAQFFASNNFALPADMFRSMNGFDTSFPLAAGEDREFCDRWLEQGYPMRYAANVQIYHAHHLTLKRFWRQHFNYGRGAFCFHQARAQRNHKSIKVEPFSFYTNLLTYPFLKASPQYAVFLSLLLFLSQVANVFGFFWEQRQPPSEVPKLA